MTTKRKTTNATPWRYFDAVVSGVISSSKEMKIAPPIYWIVDSKSDTVAMTRSERIARQLVGWANASDAMLDSMARILAADCDCHVAIVNGKRQKIHTCAIPSARIALGELGIEETK